MSSRVDRGTADGSLYRAMKERAKRHKATNLRPFENSVAHRLTEPPGRTDPMSR